jgi:hypothetical protein
LSGTGHHECLGEEHAALERGQQEMGQPGGIGLGAEAAEPLHPFEAVPEDVLPLLERVREFRANVQAGLDDLAGERAEGAAFLAGVLVGDVEARPVPKRVDAFEVGEPRTAMERQDALGLPLDDRQDKALLGREVVVSCDPLTPAARRSCSLFVAWTPLA